MRKRSFRDTFIIVTRSILLVFVTVFVTNHTQEQTPPGKGYKKIVLDASYNHTKWGIEPSDILYRFSAFTSSFDSDDDDNGDGISDVWGVPEWVAYQVKRKTKETEKYQRPKWMTDDHLHKAGIAPTDATYAVSGTRKLKEVSGSYRYVRGHMCPKDAADRVSSNAGYNTHTVLNAVPQLQWQNNGIWKALEVKVTDWADKYGDVWVVCGPIFFNKTPAVWLGQVNEVKAAVPDALYKIVIRETDKGIKALAFIIPNVIPKEKKDYSEYLTSISRVEELSGIRFLTALDGNIHQQIKSGNLSLPLNERRIIVLEW